MIYLLKKEHEQENVEITFGNSSISESDLHEDLGVLMVLQFPVIKNKSMYFYIYGDCWPKIRFAIFRTLSRDLANMKA